MVMLQLAIHAYIHIILFFIGCLRYVYTLRLIRPISYLGACYIRTKVTKCIREKMTMHFRGLNIKSHSSGYEIGPIKSQCVNVALGAPNQSYHVRRCWPFAEGKKTNYPSRWPFITNTELHLSQSAFFKNILMHLDTSNCTHIQKNTRYTHTVYSETINITRLTVSYSSYIEEFPIDVFSKILIKILI